MLEINGKPYFPPLQFDYDIPYFDFIQMEPKQNSADLEIKNEEMIKFNDCCLNQNMDKPLHKNKSPVKMNENVSNFKYSFYKIFTSKKKFPKEYVVKIHNKICEDLNLRKVSRDEARSINLYFVNFETYSKKIIMYIQQYKSSIIQEIPELIRIVN